MSCFRRNLSSAAITIGRRAPTTRYGSSAGRQRARRSASARREASIRDAESRPGRRLIFRRGTTARLVAFIHGGYWRALDKSQHSFVAGPPIDRGVSVAVMNYDLCPAVGIPDIVEECRQAVVWLARHGADHGMPMEPLVVAGHSAGGHLVAMLFATDWARYGLTPQVLAAGADQRCVRPRAASTSVLQCGFAAGHGNGAPPVRCTCRPPSQRRCCLSSARGRRASSSARPMLWEAWLAVARPGLRHRSYSGETSFQRP
jgi:hypothetical protein